MRRAIHAGFSAPHISEKTPDLLKFEIGMMPGKIGIAMPSFGHRRRSGIGVGVVEILRDRAVRPASTCA